MIVLLANFFLPCWLRTGASIIVIFLRKRPLLLKKIMRLPHDNLLTHFLGKVPYTSWLFTIYKKIPEILVGNFGSVKTVRVVHHLPKISELSRHASRLDSSYKMKLVRNSRNLMHQSIAAAPSPPRLPRTIYPPCQSRGWGI